ncbi:glucokinase [Dyella sp. EPa41]|uniref:glucokinase n=1 Tax=Dyella sp. EPa41 TaxID=1561194 RepID=UPI00191580F2|nr:glucokinase [Dyella sp. EPa41]
MNDGVHVRGEVRASSAFATGEPSGDTRVAVNPPGKDAQYALLAADVGGTHARIGLLAADASPQARDASLSVLAYCVYPCRDYAGLASIVRRFCDEHAVKPRRFALACAGYLHDGRVLNSNLQWPIEPAALKCELGMDEVSVLNDFVALAHAMPHLQAGSVMPLHRPLPPATAAMGPVVVIGPGTGLGVAVRLPGTPPQVLQTEAGHIQLAARTSRELDVLAELAPSGTHLPYDHVLSGPGLLRLHQALCRIEGKPASLHAPADVVAAAIANADSRAVEALHLFCGWLGSFTGDMAMLYGATGGIYLAGGFLARMMALLEASDFVARFLDKGVMRPFLQTVPVHVVDHAQLGVIGAASWLHERSGNS